MNTNETASSSEISISSENPNQDDCINNEIHGRVESKPREKLEKGLSIVIKEWVPECEEELKPKEGTQFQNLEQCEEFYKTYAHHVGFSVRKSAYKKIDGVIKYRYFVCSKAGFREDTNKSKGKEKVRKRKLTREGCNAVVGFRRNGDGMYVLYKFYEAHAHELATPRKQHMLRSNRGVNSVHRALFKSHSVANIGASVSHRVIKEQVGGFQNVGCSKQDLKNFQRDLKTFIKDTDAQMFIDKLKRKKEVNSSFYYAYEVDDDGRLKHVFWADGVSRRNYASYGDIVLFDTTYDTNRYKMIFAPFTGIDNHRLCSTFGAAFLVSERAETFVWLFEKFLEAMGGHKPVCIITDQDPAMKVAISQVFDTTAHRFCIWHIMRKLSEKVGVSLCGDVAFNSKFKSCVYNSETPEEFEFAWNSVILEFGLENNGWLSHLYQIRSMWIPAFFKDVFLGSVAKTTSRSESENSFFNNFTNPHLSLVEFWMRYEGAVDVQRHRQLQFEHETLSSMPELKTKRDLEKHAGTIYTYANFYKFQEQLWSACMEYEVYDRKDVEAGVLITIANACQQGGKKRQVLYDPSTHVAHCSCKMFESEGIPCRHILCLLKGLDQLPSYYVVTRWTKMASSKPIYDLDENILEGCSQMFHEDKKIQSNWMEILKCMQLAGRDLSRLDIVSKAVKGALRELSETRGDTSGSKTSELELFIGSSAPSVNEVLPPKGVHTKGSGKRIRGGKELAMEMQQKRKRVCGACGKQENHNSRTCPMKRSA